MASATLLTYMKAGTKPPLFVAGSFSAWKPEEMQYEIAEGQEEEGQEQEYRFYRKIEAEEGKEFQYKFTTGPGDCWWCDENKPKVIDNIGNTNNLLVIPRTTPSTMSELAAELTEKQSPTTEQSITSLSEKDQVKEEPQLTDAPSFQGTHSDLSEKTGESEKASEPFEEEPEQTIHQPANPSAMEEHIPTLVVEKSDDSPSFGEDLGPNSTVGEKDADATRSADAEPDQVIIRSENAASLVADTIAEVSDSAALLDARATTPEIPDKEAGEIGFRRMSSTPIPEVAQTAAEVADSALSLDQRAPTPEIGATEAGLIGLRRVSTTPIPEVSATAAEVADSAAIIDREESGTPDLTEEEVGQIGLRRLSMTPISQVAETAAEVAAVAALLDKEDHLAKHIDMPAWRSPFDDDDGKEYPTTPANERAPLLSHEKYIPSTHVSPPRSREGSLDHDSDSPAVTPWYERAPLFSHERYIDPSHRSPQLESPVSVPDAEQSDPSLYDTRDFPTNRQDIMALITKTQLDIPEDQVRLPCPVSPSMSPSISSKPDLSPSSPQRLDHRHSSLQSHMSKSLESIVEENDVCALEEPVAAEDKEEIAEKIPSDKSEDIEPARVLEVGKNLLEADENMMFSGFDGQHGIMNDAEVHGLLDAQTDKESASAVDKGADEVMEDIINKDHEQAQPFVAPQNNGKDKTEEAESTFGNLKLGPTPAEAKPFTIETGEDLVPDDFPNKTDPPTSSEGGLSYFSDLSTARVVSQDASAQKVSNDEALDLDAPCILVSPATPALGTSPMADPFSSKGSTIEEGAELPILLNEEKDHVQTQQADPVLTPTFSQHLGSKSTPAPEEAHSHIHTKNDSMDRNSHATKFHDAGTTALIDATVTRRHIVKISPDAERSSSPESIVQADGAARERIEERPGFLANFYNVVFGWFGGFFTTFCGGDRQKAKAAKKAKAAGKLKRV